MRQKFILTKELGRLARWMRLFGYDVEYFDSDDIKLFFITAFSESRIIITKRRTLSKIRQLKVIFVTCDLLKDQVRELKKKLKIRFSDKILFTRCSDCNKDVLEINKASVKGKVPPYVFETQKNFFQCPSCGKIFWKATHWDRAKEFMHEICG